MSSKVVLFESTTQELEKQELEGASGLVLADLHSQLLSIYLCNFDLCNAKFLWKRISNEEKTAFPLLGQIWEVGQKLWLKEHNSVFSLLRNTSWPPSIEPYMTCLEENLRQKSIQLIGKAYLSITSTTFTELVGYVDYPENAEKLLAKLQEEQGWTCDSASKLIIPKRQAAQNVPLMRNEEQLQSLTQFVSFLEN
ncbi:COP9 signalosome complex subunit 8-like [Daphnia pulex]|uniref:EOG090X0F3A n=1 Tax=Daphnia pulex TaxID=6669 RepID=A0A4Y7MV64_DAPPU|nr:COP9 signalosome complex subunit 8-like [Daphnia pulex]XP_046644368.1 COP9 signalosome complex subunit 8-like [Daphnia pulicaria]SVE84552.1 EOG090X0F3A [Daphnia pulex]